MARPKKSEPAPKPSALIVDPVSSQTDKLYKNIEDAPLIDKIRALEVRLDELVGIESIEVDELDPDGKQKSKTAKTSTEAEKEAATKKLLNELLACFAQLVKSPYGALSYLVKTDSESMIKLYGVDSYDDYYLKLQGSEIKVGSKKLENMVAAVGGERLLGVESNDIAIQDPGETQGNAVIADHIINEIIRSIEGKLEELSEPT